jgi:hypothetical protein
MKKASSMYATIEHGKARQFDLIRSVQKPASNQPELLGYLFGKFGYLVMTVGQRLKTQRRYGTILHAG